MYASFCVLFDVFPACLLRHKTRVKTLELNVVVFARFLRRCLKRRCSVSAAQNSFLPVAGATGSHDLTWMMLKLFGLRGERWFSKEKVLEPAPQSQELEFAAAFFLHTCRHAKTSPPPPEKQNCGSRSCHTVSASSAGCGLELGRKGFFFFTLSLYFWVK